MILVEPDQTITWANDAALAMHGVESLAELGADGRRYRARFPLRYRNNRTAETNIRSSAWSRARPFHDVDRRGDAHRPDRTSTGSIRSAASSLTDGDGSPSASCSSTGRHASGSRRSSASRDLQRQPRAGRDLPADRPALRQGQQGFLEMTGYTRDDVIGRRVYEIDVLAGARTATSRSRA